MQSESRVEVTIGAVLVAGGGVAGMQAALDLADSGFRVYLAESSGAIGGHMAQLDKTFPTNDCSMCTISPRLVAAGTHRNIEILTHANITELTGKAGNFTARLSIKPHYVDLDKCTGCGLCAENCPVSVPDEYNQLLATRKAIFKQYPQAVPNKFAITREGVAPCHDACPLHANPSGYVALTAAGKYKEAFEAAAEKNPFPSICGRICEHPCETVCNRAKLEGPVSVAYIKRFLADWAQANLPKRTATEKQAAIDENGRKVAVVGAGPAALSAALDLRKAGYRVTILEKQPVAGGMMSLGVPAYRLPREILQRDIQGILDYGIEVIFNREVKSPADIDRLFSDEFEAVLLSTGAQKSASLGIPGEQLENVTGGIEFLRDIRLGRRKSVSGDVMVVGGGNVAMDCARSAIRLGANRVRVVCLEKSGQMPAYEWEVQWALEEGIEILDGKAVNRIIEKNGRFGGLELLDVRRMAFVDGKLDLETIPGSEQTLHSGELIVAIGQRGDIGQMACEGLRIGPGGKIQVNQKTMMTDWKGVFAAGDIVRGPSSVVQAAADGRRAAASIDAWLNGRSFEPAESDQPVADIDKKELKARKLDAVERHKMPTIPLEKRLAGFDEVDLGFTEEAARAEASRCLFCAVCSWCGLCEKVCEAGAIRYDDKPSAKTLNVGAVILAPGFDLYDALKRPEYGYGRFANVVTAMDYERILSASGPFAGHIKRLSDGAEPHNIAFIQCVGSRDTENPYCSSVCCMYATKQAITTAEHIPQARCTVFVMDVRAFGKGFDEYYERARTHYGVKYVYTRPSCVRQDFSNNDLLIDYTEDGRQWIEGRFDMVVLGCGLKPSVSLKKLAATCGIDLNQYGFARGEGFVTTASSRPGVYLAGAAEAPKDIPESLAQASGAAAMAGRLLAPARGSLVSAAEFPPEVDVSAEQPRVAVFVCNCGSNIGSVINCRKVADYAAGLDDVVFSTDLMYSCSPDGLKTIKEQIAEHRANRIVVASCTPRTHEGLFQETVRQAGLNRYLFEMANIRDQCTWVHTRMGEVTERKAMDLVRMAVARARLLDPLSSKSYEPKRSALVVGGGVAGMTAALCIADQGYEVHLVEKTGSLGGNALKVKTNEDGLVPAALARDLCEKIRSHGEITVHTNSTVAECKGFTGNFKTTLNGPDRDGAIQIEHGAAIIATGAVESNPTEYLYGQNPAVLTQLRLEDVLEADPDFAAGLSEVVMIQCVGSRHQDNMVCSRVCCTAAINNAIRIKRANPQATVSVLYRDIRTYGFREKNYNEARDLGVLFFRYDLDCKPMVSQDASGRLEVETTDLNSGLKLSFACDLLVLSAAMKPSPDAEDVSKAFKVPLNLNGFFLEAHMKLRPVEFASDGLFLCGTCHSPKFTDESVVQAQAAASRAITILARPLLEISGVVSVVDPDKCAACLTCVRTCPYDVPVINKDGVAEIEPAMCHGCGVCASECPAKAIQLMHYKDVQIIAKTHALLAEGAARNRNE